MNGCRARSSQFILILVLTSFAASARAYVFDYKESGVAGYIRGTAQDTLQSSQAFSRTSGADTLFSDKVSYGFSGELGFQFNFNEQFALRLGVEGCEGKSIEANGTRASDGASLMTVDSLVTVLNPNVGLQYFLYHGDQSRIYMLMDGGYAMATVANDDNFTATGLTYYGASSNLSEKWQGTTTSYMVGLGAEYHAFDNATLAIETGYRQMEFDKFTYAQTGQVLRASNPSTNVSSGDVVTDNGGARVSLNMSGFFAGVIFRFYLPPI